MMKIKTVGDLKLALSSIPDDKPIKSLVITITDGKIKFTIVTKKKEEESFIIDSDNFDYSTEESKQGE